MAEIEKDGVNWYVPEGNFEYLPLKGHEEDRIQWVKDNFPDGDSFLDIGANVGLFSIRLARNFHEVIAVEPNPVNVYILKRNIMLNRLYNVSILDVAAWRRPEMLFFNQMVPDSLAADARVGIKAEVGAVNPPFAVMGAPMDDYFLEPDFVKMDIEGAEYEAIYGMTKIMEESKPIMMIEIHQFPDGRTFGKFQDIMASFNYKCTRVFGTDYKNVIYEPNR